MKYFNFIAIVAIVFSLALSGCEKCRTCSYSYTENGEEKTYRSQSCGNKEDRESFESFVSARADTLQYTCFEE